jgi:hypothetical protein
VWAAAGRSRQRGDMVISRTAKACAKAAKMPNHLPSNLQKKIPRSAGAKPTRQKIIIIIIIIIIISSLF